MISRGYYYARLQSAFERTFATKADLTFAVDNPEFAELFANEQKQIKLLRPLISLLAQNDGAKAAAYWKRQTPPKTPLHNRLSQLVGDLELLSGETDVHKGELEKLTGLESAKAEEYVQLKSDFRNYLGNESKNRPEVPQAEDTDEEQSTICTFYGSGMLAGMPILTSLPDGVIDFRDLGRYFTLTRAGAPTPSADAAAKGLEVLRARGLALQSECDGIKMKTADILSQQSANETNRKKLLNDSQDIVRKILFALAKPEIDRSTATAYDLFRLSLNKYAGYNLPTLWVKT